MNKFRALRADEIDCRVGTIGAKGLSLLLYKDARCDMNILDETVGPYNWQRHHSRENANCIVAIFDPAKDEWIEKEDTGTESNTEAEKGLCSDSFKRACVNWGIGRELYSSPFIWINPSDCTLEQNDKGKYVCYDRFKVQEIEYTDGRITKLVIRNDSRNITVFEFPAGKQPAKAENAVKPQKTAEKSVFIPTCAVCGKEITKGVHDFAVKQFKKPLCMDCQKKQ